jgi:hypothetical protein
MWKYARQLRNGLCNDRFARQHRRHAPRLARRNASQKGLTDQLGHFRRAPLQGPDAARQKRSQPRGWNAQLNQAQGRDVVRRNHCGNPCAAAARWPAVPLQPLSTRPFAARHPFSRTSFNFWRVCPWKSPQKLSCKSRTNTSNRCVIFFTRIRSVGSFRGRFCCSTQQNLHPLSLFTHSKLRQPVLAHFSGCVESQACKATLCSQRLP